MERHLDTPLGAVTCLDAGDGPPLLLLHGIGSSARGFAPALPHLARRRVIAPDMPGYGGSAPLADATPEAFAAWLAALLDTLALPRADMLGHSLGALLAAALAKHAPERVGTLVLSAPARGYATDEPAAWPDAARARLADLLRLGAEAYAAARAPRLLAPDAGAEAREAVRREMARLTLPGLRAATALLARGDLVRWLARKPPAAVLCGAADAIVPPDLARAAADALGAPFRLLPACGHAPYVEAPRAWAEAVLAFLALPETTP
jgi:pimeloyl-ACP methyl ester carboxylesterase